MSILFITGNKNKLAELRAFIPGIEQLDIDLNEIQTTDAKAIIEAKIKEAYQHHQGTFIVEDTSLYFESLNGLPGPLIKWFIKSLGREGLYNLAHNSGNVKATAKTLIGLSNGPDDIHYFEGSIGGKIVFPRGETAFGWDPIFQPEGYNQTFAEMSPDQKNEISHRRRAVDKLLEYLKQNS